MAPNEAELKQREAELKQREAELKQREAEFKQKEADFKKDEWKECRATIDRCDKLLVELRKTGFGLMTAIVTTAVFLMVRPGSSGTSVAEIPELARFAIFLTIILLALALYYLDHIHQNFLRAAVARATKLEEEIKYEITKRISEAAPSFRTGFYGTLLYAIVIGASNFSFVVVQGWKGWQAVICDLYIIILALGSGGAMYGVALITRPKKTAARNNRSNTRV
jgi:hypothetical protein